jgi:hypothetical protein
MGEKASVHMPKSSCKKSVTAPLKTLNLQQNPTEPYSACPFCLTKIKTEQPLEIDQKPQEQIIQKAELKIDQVEAKEKPLKSEKPSACHHHPGYLSERSSKEQIPDECMVCKDIVECMLKKMRE